MSRHHDSGIPLVAWVALFLMPAELAFADPVSLPDFSDVEDRTEYEGASWFGGISHRRNANRLGLNDRHTESPDGLDDRREAIIDALWRDDPGAFFELTHMSEMGRPAVDLPKFRRVSHTMEPFRGHRLRTMRQHPWVSADRPGKIWGCHQWMSLTDPDHPPQRGNLQLLFDQETTELLEIRVTLFPAGSEQTLLPMPDSTLVNDPIRDREAVQARREIDPRVPPDFTLIEDGSEYLDRNAVTSICRRSSVDSLGITEWFVKKPTGLDDRCEALLDALWNDDEEVFLELAMSPKTGEGGLKNQEFRDISREFQRYRREGLRTLRHHPIDPNRASSDDASFWVRFQWMSLSDNRIRTPARGNLNLIFDTGDLSLAHVRFNPFKGADSISALPYPDESIPNDPVRDRAPVEER